MTGLRFAELTELRHRWIRDTGGTPGREYPKESGGYRLAISTHYDRDGELFGSALWLAIDCGSSFLEPIYRMAVYAPNKERLVDDIRHHELSLKAMNHLDGQKVTIAELPCVEKEVMIRAIENSKTEL